MDMVGEPENLALLQKAMETVGYYPDVILQTANFYDKKLTDNGGDAIKNTWVRSCTRRSSWRARTRRRRTTST